MPASEVKQFIAKNFLFSDDADAVREDQSLMSSGTLDSTGILELIMFVEERFGLKVADEEMLRELRFGERHRFVHRAETRCITIQDLA